MSAADSQAGGRRPSRCRASPARAPRPAPRAPPAGARPAASSASPAPRGDHNMAAAQGLLFWLLLLGPPWRVPGQPEQDPGRRFSQLKLCADEECSSECREGGGGAGASPGRERELGRPASRPGGRRPVGRSAGWWGRATSGSLRLSPPAFRAPGQPAWAVGVSASHLLPAFHFSFVDGGGGWCGGFGGGPPVSPGAARNVPSPGTPRLRGDGNGSRVSASVSRRGAACPSCTLRSAFPGFERRHVDRTACGLWRLTSFSQ